MPETNSVATDEPKPVTEDDEVAEWDALCEHAVPEGAARWYPDDKEPTK